MGKVLFVFQNPLFKHWRALCRFPQFPAKVQAPVNAMKESLPLQLRRELHLPAKSGGQETLPALGTGAQPSDQTAFWFPDAFANHLLCAWECTAYGEEGAEFQSLW